MFNFKIRPQTAILFLILILSFWLNYFKIHDIGYGNSYYAAAVRSMLANLHNFFFAAYDPGGFVSIDKPPVALWVQCLNASIFGFHGWALLLPQALAGVVSVLLLYKIVRKNFGEAAGFLAAGILAITPVFVAVNRTNEVDPILIMIIMLAAVAVNSATQKGSMPLLLLSMCLIGLGFNTKMLQAFLVIPAFYVLYIISSPVKIGRKVIDLSIATVILLVISLSWAFIVDTVPARDRPYSGSSNKNSEINLALFYNGIFRIIPEPVSYPIRHNKAYQILIKKSSSVFNNNIQSEMNEFAKGKWTTGGEIGYPGLLRFFNQQMAGQISWLLLITFSGIIVYIIGIKKTVLKDQKLETGSVLFWSFWVFLMMACFSEASFFHRYYLALLAPGMAALSGIGICKLNDEYLKKERLWWMLPVSITLNAGLQFIFLSRYPGWFFAMVPAILGLCIISSGILIFIRLSGKLQNKIFVNIIVTISCVGLFIAPLIWSLTPILFGDQIAIPFAGPELKDGKEYYFNYFLDNRIDDKKVVEFLINNNKGERYLAGVPNSFIASQIIIDTGMPVMAMGGYMGADNILSIDDLKKMLDQGQVRFFLIYKIPSNMKNIQKITITDQFSNIEKLSGWISKNGKPVDENSWMDKESNSYGSNSISESGNHIRVELQLYDLRPKG